MCKKCEIQGITMELEFLTIPSLKKMEQKLSQIKAWENLFKSGWHEEDLIQRAYAHLVWTMREAEKCNQPHWVTNARAFLSAMAKGFLNPFNPEQFKSKSNEDPNYAFKMAVVSAISEASNFYGNRCPSVLWNSFAYLGTREDPEESRSILKEASELPHHYAIVDTMLHASAKCYKLLLTVQSFMFQKTGMVIDHNCDCNCSLVNLLAGLGDMAVVFKIRPEQIHEATQSAFTHMLAESHLILNCKLPFEYTVTKEAGLLQGIDVKD